MDELITPLFGHKEPGGRYEMHEVSAFGVYPGIAEGTFANRCRRFAREGWIQVRGHRKSGITASNLFAPSDIAAAVALSAMVDMGADHETMTYAALGLYACQPGQADLIGHPITNALRGATRDERDQWWVVEARTLRDDQTGERHVFGYCYEMDDPPRPVVLPSLSLIPFGTITVALTPLLIPLVRRLREHAKAARRLDA